MIAVLTFARSSVTSAGRRLRFAHFERRSSLPVSAACLVANGMREMLGSVLGRPAGVRLLEPVIPAAQAWDPILCDARVYRVCGPLGEAAIILQSADALRLAAAVFGEGPQSPRPLSAIEEQVLARVVRSMASSLAPVCGSAERLTVVQPVERTAYLTYFELLVDGPVTARIGVALARDPTTPAQNCLRIDDLLEVELELCVEFARAEVAAGELLLLKTGTELRMNTKVGAPATLKLAERIVARGECGALGGQGAFVVGAHPKGGNS